MKSTEQFIRQANEKHNFKYDYSFKTPFNLYEDFIAKYQIKIN